MFIMSKGVAFIVSIDSRGTIIKGPLSGYYTDQRKKSVIAWWFFRTVDFGLGSVVSATAKPANEKNINKGELI